MESFSEGKQLAIFDCQREDISVFDGNPDDDLCRETVTWEFESTASSLPWSIQQQDQQEAQIPIHLWQMCRRVVEVLHRHHIVAAHQKQVYKPSSKARPVDE